MGLNLGILFRSSFIQQISFIFYYKSYGAGQALMVRDIKAITHLQKARRQYDSMWSNLYPTQKQAFVLVHHV